MSKIGKKNILLPKDTSVKIEGGKLTISGPKKKWIKKLQFYGELIGV